MIGAVASFIDAPDGASSWLVRTRRETGPIDGLVPPGSMCPYDRGVRQAHWTRCWWGNRGGHPQTDSPDACEVVRVEEALLSAQRWAGQERWVLEQSLDYAHLLLRYVCRSLERHGQLEREVCRILADPALDLLGELRLIAADQRYVEYAKVLRNELAELPLVDGCVLRREAPAKSRGALARGRA